VVENDRLTLRELRVFFDPGNSHSKPRTWEGVTPKYGDNGHIAVYSGLDRLVPFTGGLLLGNGFIEELYEHMGFHPAWKFREVHELVFREGQLQRAADCSEAADKFRKTFAAEALKPPDMNRVKRWIEQTFSLRYERD